MDSIISIRGELAALFAALIWALTSTVYAGIGQQIPPLPLNLLKGLAAIGFTLVTLAGRQSPDLNWPSVGLLALSGAVGIGLGDTAFFESLNCLGARRGLLLEALAPPLAALIAWLALGERLPTLAYWGILLTVSGVAWVVVERTPPQVTAAAIAPDLQTSRPPENDVAKFLLLRGIGFGSLAALAQASGAVLSRAALADTAVPPLWSSLIRLVGGCAVLTLWLGARPQPGRFKALRSPRLIVIVIATAFASTFLAIWLQQTALKYTATGVAQAIGATSPLFVIPIALLLGDRVSSRAILGAITALVGVCLLFIA
ncbi:MAG: EamA family transporter [Elainellaceae cyanobacterium]